MIDRAQVEARLRKKQAEGASYEDKIRAAKAYIAALTDILKIDAGDNQGSAEAKLRPGSAVAQARDIILERRSAVHIDDLLRAMGKEVTRDSKASLAGSLAAYVRKDEIFSRPAPNTYGLIELGHTTVEVEEEPEIPPSFGETKTSDFDELEDDVPF